MRKLSIVLVAAGLVSLGCDGQDPTSPAGEQTVQPQFATGGVIHRVSVGSHDIVPPGVDANFSLIAIQHADGTVTGQYTDRFAQGGGFHATVTCLSVNEATNTAWIGGVITRGAFAGLEVITAVQDNGTSTSDAPDLVSFSFVGVPAQTCLTQPLLPLFPLQGGEVKVE